MRSAGDVCRSLLEAGIVVSPAEARVEARDDCTVAFLPGDRLAWFADTERGVRLLDVERRVLGLVEQRCSFRVPHVLHVAADGSFDVRAPVPGQHQPWELHARAKADTKLAARIGAQLGGILAEQHTRVAAADAASWLPSRPHWPEPSAWIRERIPRVTPDRRLFDDICAMLARHDAVVVDERDRVLVHGDIGLHNIAVDPETCDVQGVFDYKDAAWADRHHDFRYLLFDDERDDMLEAALAVYEQTSDRRLSRARIALANAASAASFLAFRDGVPPDQSWCGRTLEQDLAWTRVAIDRWAKLRDDAPRTIIYAVLRGPLRFDDGTTLDEANKQMLARARFGKIEE
jgi:aminoglycoside phosphotransferase (APT) family kinase protein